MNGGKVESRLQVKYQRRLSNYLTIVAVCERADGLNSAGCYSAQETDPSRCKMRNVSEVDGASWLGLHEEESHRCPTPAVRAQCHTGFNFSCIKRGTPQISHMHMTLAVGELHCKCLNSIVKPSVSQREQCEV